MDEIKLLENQLKRMRSMNRFYHLQFLNDVRYFFVIGLISLIISFNSDKTLYLLPLIALFGSVILAFHAYYLIFSRNYSEYIEKKINNSLNKEAYITHKLEMSWWKGMGYEEGKLEIMRLKAMELMLIVRHV